MRGPSDGDRNRRQLSDLPPIDSPETFPGWDSPWPRFEVDWTRAALVVVDVQNYGCNVDAGLGPMLTEHYPEIARYYLPRVTQTVVPNAVRLLDAFRATGRRVVFTRHGPLLPDGSDMIERRRRRDADAVASTGTPALWHRGTFEHEVVAALAPVAGEVVLDKNTSSAFNSTGLEWLLRNMTVETLVLVGIATDMCVETTARDAADRGFNVILVEDATATFFEHHHRAALSGFARVFGQVWDTEQVLSALTTP
jgi:nicotinamidase-related amidase